MQVLGPLSATGPNRDDSLDDERDCVGLVDKAALVVTKIALHSSVVSWSYDVPRLP